MKFKSGMITLLAMATMLTITGCGKQASSDHSQASSSSAKSTAKSSSSTTSSDSSATSSASNSSESTSSSQSSSSSNDDTQISNQAVGILIWKKVNPKFFNEQIKDGMYYGTNSKNDYVNGYDFITAHGDVSTYVFYKVNGDQVIYKAWNQTGQATMDGHYKTTTVSLQSLVDQFYNTADQKSKVQADVKEGLTPYSQLNK